jgi:transposase-like protein
MSTSASAASEPETSMVPISSIRQDGQTQHRILIDPAIVSEYADLMRAGVVFPPIRVWGDGNHLWLSDGFQRIAAGKEAGFTEIPAQVFHGTLNDARWDSYAVNATHGMRRTPEETKRTVRLAIEHPNASHLSNVELAKHLHLPEATLRRWRKKLSSSTAEDAVRTVTRGKVTYQLKTSDIGKNPSARNDKPRRHLRVEIETMKEAASPKVRRLLNIVGNWAFGSATHSDCLDALERVLRE